MLLVINLDRSPERLASFMARAAQVGISVERLAAIDAKTMDEAGLNEIKVAQSIFDPLSRGEIACFLSHRAAWRRLVDSGVDRMAIFEDDAVLAADIGVLLDQLSGPGWDIVRLETTRARTALGPPEPVPGTAYELCRHLSWHGGTAGYVITRAAAIRLLAATTRLEGAVDQVLFHPFSPVSKDLAIMQLVPGAVIQEEFLHGRHRDRQKTSTVRDGQPKRGLFRYGPLADLRRLTRRVAEGLVARRRGPLVQIAFREDKS